MKTKRVLSFILALMLGLALLIPAGALNIEPADPNAPIISRLHARHISGTTVALAVEAKLPESTTGELSYRWYLYENMFSSKFVAEGANPTVEIARKPIENYWDFDQVIDNLLPWATYYVYITNTYTDEGGNTKTSTIISDGIQVTMAIPLWTALSEYWQFGIVVENGTFFGAGVFFLAMTMPIFLPAFIYSRFLFAFASVIALFR